MVSRAHGKIICISSVHEVIPWAGHANYAASKGGIMLMMKSLAQEVAEHRIRVNGIAPGAIRTVINRLTSPGKVDTGLCGFAVCLSRGDVSDGGVDPLPIVVAADPVGRTSS
jgi:glucose 1-dehydrogenase